MGLLKTHTRRTLAAIALLLLMAAPAKAQQALELYEQKIKAGLVYNFLKYTTWPQAALAGGSLRVCLYGEGPFDDYLSPLKGRTAQQHDIDVVHVDTPAGAGDCHLLFIHRETARALPALLPALKGKPVLTVSDIEGFAARGGMVELTRLNQRVGLSINSRAVSAHGLAVQPRLMKLAASAR